VHTHKQGVDGVMAVAAINVGEMQLHARRDAPRGTGQGRRWREAGEGDLRTT
jgi:hypothetical protein